MHASPSDSSAEQVFEALMATSSDAIISKTVEGIITGWNPAAEELYGYSADEAIGQPITLIMPAGQQGEVPVLMERLTRGERIERYETLRRHKDGHLVEVSLTVSPVKDRAGKVVGALSLTHDISLRKELAQRNEDLLRKELAQRNEDVLRSGDRFERLVDANIIGVMIADITHIFEANDIFLSMIGYSREELAQGNIRWTGMTPPEYAPLDQKALQELRTRGVCTPYEKEYVRKNGTRVPVLVGAALLQEVPFQCVSFVLDLTAQKELERRKSELVTTTSHELRTPLTSIKGYVEVLKNTLGASLTPDQRTYLQIIQRNVTRLVALVNDLLDLSHLEAGTVQVQRRVLDLGGLLQEVAQTFQPHLLAKRQQLSIHLLPSPPVVLGDPSRMLQILTNLLSNAHKFTPEEGTITLSLQQQEQETVTIEVQDSGIGMTSAEQSHLFTTFYRAHPSPKEEEGTGMGLVISRALVEMQGGSISVESAPGRGSTFRVTLPIVRQAPLSGKRVFAHGGKRILVVEDEPDHSQLVRYLLEQQGHEVLSTYWGEDVVALATRMRPDLILLDAALLEGNGLHVLEQLKGQQATAPIPVLLLTITESKEEGVLQGAFDVLAKPFSQAQLQRRIAAITQEAQQPLALVATQDPIALASLLKDMRRAGYRVLEARDAHTLLRLVASQRPHLVFLDGEVLSAEVRDLFDHLIEQLAVLQSALVLLGPLPFTLQRRDDLQREGRVRIIDQPTSVEEAVAPDHSAPPQRREAGSVQVLIVDDDPEIGELVPLLLPEYAVLQATSGQEALQRMRETPPDLVLLDWIMPEMDGLEVLQAMRADVALAHIPVIMVSANYQEAEVEAGLLTGADGYLVKPFAIPDLQQAIAELLATGQKVSVNVPQAQGAQQRQRRT